MAKVACIYIALAEAVDGKTRGTPIDKQGCCCFIALMCICVYIYIDTYTIKLQLF